MTTAAEKVFDAAVKHRIGFGRYSSWMVRRVISQLNRVEKDIISRLAEAAPESLTGARLEVQLDAIRVLQADAWVTIKRRFTDDLTETADAESVFAERLARLAASEGAYTGFSPRPTPSQVMGAVLARPFQGKFLREALDDLEEGQAKAVRETIRQGFIEGRPTADIVRSLRGTKANQYRDGVLERSRRSVEGMVRTAMTHTSVVAHEEVYKANADVVLAVEWVSTLDGRTSMICISRDGKRFPIGKGPRPPAHYGGCRSTTIPVVGEIEGVVPFKRPTYPEWLAKQSPATQDEILGRSRGALYRSGGLKVEKFVDDRGKIYSLADLRKSDDAAFGKAGLDLPMQAPKGVPKDEIAKFLADPGAQRALLNKLYGSESYAAHSIARVREIADEEGWRAQDHDLASIRHYTGNGYGEINRRMRESGGTLEDRQFSALASRGAMDLPDETAAVWRAPAKRADVADRMWDRAAVGEDLDLGNQLHSFSRSRDFATTWSGETRLLLEIENPRHGAYIEPISLNPGEDEVLFPLGLKYRVAAKREDVRYGRVYRVIVLEVVD